MSVNAHFLITISHKLFSLIYPLIWCTIWQYCCTKRKICYFNIFAWRPFWIFAIKVICSKISSLSISVFTWYVKSYVCTKFGASFTFWAISPNFRNLLRFWGRGNVLHRTWWVFKINCWKWSQNVPDIHRILLIWNICGFMSHKWTKN